MRSPRRVPATVLERLAEWYRISDEIDAVALARLLGTEPTWVTLQAVKPKKRHAPRLVCKRAPNGARLRGVNNRLLFDVDDVTRFVSDVERAVTLIVAPHIGSATLPLVSATDPRIGTVWNTLERFGAGISTPHGALKRVLGEPAAFFIGRARRGYSVAWSDAPWALRPFVANDNGPVTPQACGAKP